MNDVGKLATDIYDYELGSPSGISVSNISGWINNNVGRLNILIDSDFCVETGTFKPELKQEESVIFTQIYLIYYYKNKVNRAQRGLEEGDSWISFAEDDRRVTRSNKNEIVKSFLSLQKQAKEDLADLLTKYNGYLASPRQVAGYDAPVR